MKSIKYIMIALTLFCMAFVGCKDEEGTYLTLNTIEKNLSPKDSFQFELKIQGLNVPAGEKIVWTLQNPQPKVTGTEVATISSDGLLKASGLGTVTVKASVGGRYALAQVNVVDRVPAPLEDLKFSKDAHYMSIEGSLPDTVLLTVKASLLSLYDLKLTSDNQEIIRAEMVPDEASHKGEAYITKKIALFRGGKEGMATISADTGGGTVVSMKVFVGVKAYLSFEKINTSLGGIPSLTTSNPYTFYVNSTNTITIYYYATPNDQAHLDKLQLSVTSEGDGVLSVKDYQREQESFKITVEAGKLKGNQKLTFKLYDNVLTADCNVMDKNDVNVNSVKFLSAFKDITTSEKALALGEGVKVDPLASIVHWPIVWTSSDKSIATVNSLGDVVIYKAGKVTITATSKDKSDFCTITSKLKIDGIAFAPNLTTTLAESETTTWKANVTANYDASSVVKNWESSKPSVATVDAHTGKITAIGEGTAEITVSVIDNFGNQKSAKQTITVTSVNIASLDFNSKKYQYLSDVATNGTLSGISIDAFTLNYTENYSFKLYKTNSGVNFNLSGNATYTVGVDIHTASIINYLDSGESAILQPGSKLIVNNGVLTFDMTAKRGTKTVTIKGNVTPQ